METARLMQGRKTRIVNPIAKTSSEICVAFSVGTVLTDIAGYQPAIHRLDCGHGHRSVGSGHPFRPRERHRSE